MNTRAFGSRAFAATVFVAAVGLTLTACVPEPQAMPTSSASATPSVSASASPTGDAAPSAPSASAEPTEAEPDRPQALEISLPGSCDAVGSSALHAELEASVGPAGNGAVSIATTNVNAAQGLLDSDPARLRCTWGSSNDAAVATTVAIVDAADLPRLQDALAGAGVYCESTDGGVLCQNESEQHFLRGNGWVSTSWTGTLPEGYTHDVATSLWG